jgi:hypothetical protein
MFLICNGIKAQYGAYGITDARSIALGNTYNASSYQLYSLGTNPSLLAWNDFDKHAVQLHFPNATLQSYSFSTFDDFITGLTSSKPSELFRGITSGKLLEAYNGVGSVAISGLINFMSVGYQPSQKIGYFAFGAADYISSTLNLPGAFVDFQKDEGIKGSASLGDFEFKSWWLRNYSISYARKIHTGWDDGLKEIYVGTTLKYIKGYAYTDVALNSSLVFNSQEDVFLYGNFIAGIQYSFSENIAGGSPVDSTEVAFKYPNLKSSGTGFAVDLGVSLKFQESVVVGLAVTDVGSIKWGGVAGFHLVGGAFAIDKEVTKEDLSDLFDSVYTISRNTDEFSTYTASTFRFGITFRLNEMLNYQRATFIVTGDINQALNTQAPGNYPAPRFSAGIAWQHRPKLPMVLTGFSYDQYNSGRWGFGLGYRARFVEIFISTLDLLNFFRSTDRASISLSLLWTINKKDKE